MNPFYYFQSYGFIIFNHIPTHIVPNLNVHPPLPQTTLVTQKNGHLNMPRPNN